MQCVSRNRFGYFFFCFALHCIMRREPVLCAYPPHMRCFIFTFTWLFTMAFSRFTHWLAVARQWRYLPNGFNVFYDIGRSWNILGSAARNDCCKTRRYFFLILFIRTVNALHVFLQNLSLKYFSIYRSVGKENYQLPQKLPIFVYLIIRVMF